MSVHSLSGALAIVVTAFHFLSASAIVSHLGFDRAETLAVSASLNARIIRTWGGKVVAVCRARYTYLEEEEACQAFPWPDTLYVAWRESTGWGGPATPDWPSGQDHRRAFALARAGRHGVGAAACICQRGPSVAQVRPCSKYRGRHPLQLGHSR